MAWQTGDQKEVVVAAADGYGELDPEAYADVPRNEFPPQIPMEVGIELQLKDQERRYLGCAHRCGE